MADHSKPTTTSLYTDVLSDLDGRLDDIALGLDPANTSPTNVPTNAIRWTSASNKWQKWNGSAWSDLSSAYSININGTVGATTPAAGTFTTLASTGNTTLGDASGDAVTINASTVSTPNGLNFDSNTLVIDATNNYVGIGTSSPAARLQVQQNGAGKQQIARFENLNAGAGHRLQISVNDDDNEVVYQSTGSTAGAHVFEAGSTEKVRIDSDGNVGINTSTPIDTLDVDGGITISAADALEITGTDSTSTQAVLTFYRGGGGDKTGQFCKIRTIGDGANNAVQMLFDTASTERMRLTSDGYLRMASGTGGIQFGGDTAAANALDDYEEGTWTPVISDANSGGNVSPTAATSAIYTKVGRMVTVQCFFTNIDTTGMTAGNNFTIQGFPFTAASVTGTVIIPGSIIVQNVTFSGYLTPALFDNNTYARIAENTTGATATYVLVSDTSSGVTDFYLNMTYQAAS